MVLARLLIAIIVWGWFDPDLRAPELERLLQQRQRIGGATHRRSVIARLFIVVSVAGWSAPNLALRSLSSSSISGMALSICAAWA